MDVKINSFKKLFHVNGDGTFTSLKYTLRRPVKSLNAHPLYDKCHREMETT